MDRVTGRNWWGSQQMMIFIPPNDFSCADSRLPSVSILIFCEGSWTVAQK